MSALREFCLKYLLRKPANKKSSPKQDLSEEKFTGSR